jgi:hypothetical protein
MATSFADGGEVGNGVKAQRLSGMTVEKEGQLLVGLMHLSAGESRVGL